MCTLIYNYKYNNSNNSEKVILTIVSLQTPRDFHATILNGSEQYHVMQGTRDRDAFSVAVLFVRDDCGNITMMINTSDSSLYGGGWAILG